jgi:hypothetical protein
MVVSQAKKGDTFRVIRAVPGSGVMHSNNFRLVIVYGSGGDDVDTPLPPSWNSFTERKSSTFNDYHEFLGAPAAEGFHENDGYHCPYECPLEMPDDY